MPRESAVEDAGLKVPAAARHAAVAAAGAALSLLVAQALTLEPRYVAAFVAGMLLLGASLALLRLLPDLLLYVLAFNLSFTSIAKTFFRTEETTFVISGIPIGLADLCLIGLYVLWFSRIFIQKTAPLPKPSGFDWWVLIFWLIHAISVFGAASPGLALLEVVRLGNYALMYFYLAHNLKRAHLKWIAAGILFTLTVQSSLAVVQYRKGSLLGIGRTKGASDLNYEQYTVTGFENVSRAEGTTFDSHALGLFCAMMLPVPLALSLAPGLRWRHRAAAAGFFLLGVPGLVASFTRAGWLAFAGAAGVLVLALSAGAYRQMRRRLLAGSLTVLALGGVAMIPLLPQIRQRLFEAPPELVTARFETLQMGFEMWRAHMWFGCGANNYMHMLEKTFSIFEGDPYFIPAHNMLVFVLTELGIIGLAVFLLFGAAAWRMNWKTVRLGDPLVQAMAGTCLAGLAAVFIEGLSDPIYATTVTYFAIWFQLGLGAGLQRLALERVFAEGNQRPERSVADR